MSEPLFRAVAYRLHRIKAVPYECLYCTAGLRRESAAQGVCFVPVEIAVYEYVV